MTRIAICYWGLTRSTRQVYQTHRDNIWSRLRAAGIEYDVFVHTWATKKPMTWGKIDPPQDETEYKLLEPTEFQRDNQDEFLAGLNFAEYWNEEIFRKHGDGPKYEWYPFLVRNHLCALESQRRVTEMMLASGNEYTFVMYVRPDARIDTPFPVECLSTIGPKDIVIPDFKHCEGLNDRFAVVPWAYCQPYGCRITEIREFRKTQGRIVSEKYVKFIITKHYQNVRLIPFTFEFIRAPADSKPRCAQCDAPATNKCGRCQASWYCGKECQAAAWSEHKVLCKRV
jgi:hypothetical protein